MAFLNDKLSLQAGVKTYVVPFSPAFDTIPDSVLPVVANVSNDATKELLNVTVVGKTVENFTIYVDPAPPTNNYEVYWMAGTGGFLTQMIVSSGRRIADLPLSLEIPTDADYFPIVTTYPVATSKRLTFATLRTMFPRLQPAAPEKPSSPGKIGDMAIDSDFLYVHNGIFWSRVLMQQVAWVDADVAVDGPRKVTVANDTARYALTIDDVRNGFTVYVTATGENYLVVDQTQLSSTAGYAFLPHDGPGTLQFREGTEAERKTVIPASGEPVWTTDEKVLYVGDGTRKGGHRVSRLSAKERVRDFIAQYMPANWSRAMNESHAITGVYRGTTSTVLPFKDSNDAVLFSQKNNLENITTIGVRSSTGYVRMMDGNVLSGVLGNGSSNAIFVSMSNPTGQTKFFGCYPCTSTGDTLLTAKLAMILGNTTQLGAYDSAGILAVDFTRLDFTGLTEPMYGAMGEWYGAMRDVYLNKELLKSTAMTSGYTTLNLRNTLLEEVDLTEWATSELAVPTVDVQLTIDTQNRNLKRLIGLKESCISILVIDGHQMTELDVSGSRIAGASQLVIRNGTLTSLTGFVGRNSQYVGGQILDIRYNNLSAAALNAIFTNLGLAGGKSEVKINGNPGTDTCNTAILDAKGWRRSLYEQWDFYSPWG